MSKKTELATVNADNYPVLAGEGNIGEIIRGNMGGEAITAADLNRIKVPSGGSTIWSVQGPDGEDEAVKVLEGIIVFITMRRAYWPDTTPSGTPPVCSSVDCITGVGEPGGSCDECRYSLFKSAVRPDGSEGNGQACKQTKLLFMLRPGKLLPDVVCVPAGSLKVVKHWQVTLPYPFVSVITKLALKKVQSIDGIDYSQVTPSMGSVLDASVAKQIRKYARDLEAVFSAVQIESSDSPETEEV